MALALSLAAAPGAAQQGPPADTFEDAATRALVERAIEAREREAMGIRSYEATLRQRIYAGLTAFRFRRERSLFEHERIARIRWSDDGEQAIQWIGARTAVPIVGIDSRDPEGSPGQANVLNDNVSVEIGDRPDREPDSGDDREWEDDDDLGVTAEAYLQETEFPGFDFDPAADRLRFGDDWAFHPLADTALVNYRYALGDTLRIDLPANERSVVLYELRVEPRRPDFELLAGSLWVDSASASVVRATYRPARPWSMRLDEPEAAAEVPGFVSPIEAEISYITVESSLQELEYWLPRRFAFRAEGRAGGLLRVPVTLEWTVGGYIVNEPPADVLVDGALPEGWQREVTVEVDDDGNETRYTVIVPTTEELIGSPLLSEDFGRRAPVTFTGDELDQLAARLEGLLPVYRPFPPHVAWGLEQGQLRFNRVEALSAGAATTVAVRPELVVDLSARIGVGDRVPNGLVRLRAGPETGEWSLEAYHRLASLNDRDDPFTLANSLKNLGAGLDRGQYYRATGGTVGYRGRGPSVRTEIRAFYEHQRSVKRTTDFSLVGIWRDPTVPDVLQFEAIDLVGLRGLLGWSLGTDPSGWIITGEVTGEAGFATGEYQRGDARLSLSHPLFFGLAGAVEAAAGTSWGDLPLQRQFFLGASQTLRGFYINEFFGPTYWRARAEVATGFVGARVALFSDVGWVGERADFRLDDPLASVGVGVSLLDGLARGDVTRAVRGSNRWKIELYLDGLF